jgi:hypothetical protein
MLPSASLLHSVSELLSTHYSITGKLLFGITCYVLWKQR